MQVIFHQFSPTFVKIINKNSVLGNSLGRIHRYIDQNGPNMVLNGIQLTRVGDSSEMTIVAWLTIWTTLFRPYGFGINMFSLQFNTQNIVFYSPSPPLPIGAAVVERYAGDYYSFPIKTAYAYCTTPCGMYVTWAGYTVQDARKIRSATRSKSCVWKLWKLFTKTQNLSRPVKMNNMQDSKTKKKNETCTHMYDMLYALVV